jgi:DNA-binding transcriptional LysR family regulator
MQRSPQHDVARIAPPDRDAASLALDWDDLRLFLAVAEAGSFRAAGVELGMQASSVMRRIDQLEHRVKAKLFERAHAGIRLTAEGLSILDDARELKDRFQSIQRKVAWKQKQGEGVVSVAATDGLGAFWIAPRLLQFRQVAPRIKINLKCAMDVPDVARSSADIGLQIERPTGADIIFAKVGRLHIWPYASRRYAETFGLPRSTGELLHHRYVVQAANQLDESMFLKVLGAREFSDIDAVRTNTSTAHYAMVTAGLGIGCLPTYLGSASPDLVPLDIGPAYSLDLFVTYRQAIGDLVRVRRVVDWLKTIFDSRANPLFGDDLLVPCAAEPSRYRDDILVLPLDYAAGESARPSRNTAGQGEAPSKAASGGA